MTLYLVCDISGSMDDDGRPFIMRTAVMTIAQWVRLGYGLAQIKLYAWGSQATLLSNWNVQQEYPAELLVCDGTSNWNSLVQMFGDKPGGRILLLSDGFWSSNESRIYRQWKKCLPPDTLRIVRTGLDASPQLKGSDVFAAEDLLAALDGWLESAPA